MVSVGLIQGSVFGPSGLFTVADMTILLAPDQFTRQSEFERYDRSAALVSHRGPSNPPGLVMSANTVPRFTRAAAPSSAISMIDLASWLGSLGRLGCLSVIVWTVALFLWLEPA
jgi:hypothetical protein